jgi:hypothetical protein
MPEFKPVVAAVPSCWRLGPQQAQHKRRDAPIESIQVAGAGWVPACRTA